MAKITLHRLDFPRDYYRKYKIFINNKHVCSISNDETIELNVPSGRCTIKATIDWCSSQPLIIDLLPDDDIPIAIEPNFRGFLATQIITALTSKKNDYISVYIGIPSITTVERGAVWLSFVNAIAKPFTPSPIKDLVGSVLFGVYRKNATSKKQHTPLEKYKPVKIYEEFSHSDYVEKGRVKVKIEARTIFSKKPSIENVNLKLQIEAKKKGANAVINVKYHRGMSWTSWSALTATGMAIIYDESIEPTKEVN